MSSFLLGLALCVVVTSAQVTSQPQMCSDVGSLSSRFYKHLQANDVNSDGLITGIEVYNDIRFNYDVNKDNCVTQQEFVARFTTFYRFSMEFALVWYQYLVTQDALNPNPIYTCAGGLNYLKYQFMTASLFTSAQFLNDDVQRLVTLCTTQPDRRHNCDCAALETSCRFSSTIKDTAACRGFVTTLVAGGVVSGNTTTATEVDVCSGKGTLSERFERNMKVNDPSGDGYVTGPEIYLDFRTNYDLDLNGCVTKYEWVERWTSYFGFSEAYAEARLASLVSNVTVACPLVYAPYRTDAITKIPRATFLDDNMQTLVTLCASPATPVNCDCTQLSTACRVEPLLMTLPACQAVAVNPVVG